MQGLREPDGVESADGRGLFALFAAPFAVVLDRDQHVVDRAEGGEYAFALKGARDARAAELLRRLA